MIVIRNVRTQEKRALAKVLRALADWVEGCRNESVTISLNLTFNPTEEG